MNHSLELLGLVVCILASAAYSGSETGYYRLNRTRVELEARGGRRSARLSSTLLRDETALLITILIGNNLFLELTAHLGDRMMTGWIVRPELRALCVTLLLTPLVLLFGEAIPKEVFRRRPHSWTARTADFMSLSRILFWPLQRMLRGLSWLLERSFHIHADRVGAVHAREVVLDMLAEGARSGALAPRAEALARNALELRTTPISNCMEPWNEVIHLRRGQREEEMRELVTRSPHSRLPVLDADGTCEGYVHQLDVMSAEEGEPVLKEVLPLTTLDPSTTVDQALRTLRGTGRRVAVVLDKETMTPVGLISLKDLVEEISGELAGW
ncbi:MAG: putative hemolysin [Planctomycetota bacterium]|jgi:putative hemolysin